MKAKTKSEDSSLRQANTKEKHNMPAEDSLKYPGYATNWVGLCHGLLRVVRQRSLLSNFRTFVGNIRTFAEPS